jgi:hypothetical protein
MGLGSSSSEKTRDEKSVQADINKALKDSGGKWTSNLNDLVAERDRARAGSSSGGGQGFFDTLKSVPAGISRDVSMGVSAGLFSNRDKQRANLKATGKYTDAQINDYFARTDATLARNAAEAAARSNRSDDSPSAITPRPSRCSFHLKSRCLSIAVLLGRRHLHSRVLQSRPRCGLLLFVHSSLSVALVRSRTRCCRTSRALGACAPALFP